MQLLAIKIPELGKIPAERRDDVLRQCLESAEIRKLRSNCARYAFVIPAILISGGLAILLQFFHWNLAVVIPIATILIMALALGVVIILKPILEYLLVRRLLRKLLGRMEH